MLHVELIQNEWAAGQQRVVARLTLNGGGEIQIESTDDEVWREIVLRPFRDSHSGRDVSPEENPEAFLLGLHDHLRGDYLFATEPHSEDQCDLAVGMTVSITRETDRHHAAHLAH
jgi:hypothetical protein